MTSRSAKKKGVAAIIGAYEHPSRLSPGYSPLRFMAESARGVLEDAGLDKSAVDGLAHVGDASAAFYVTEYLGLKPRWIDTSSYGGSSYITLSISAAEAVMRGAAQCVLILYGSNSRSRADKFGTMVRGNYQTDPMYVDDSEQYLTPYGAILASHYALVATKHMAKYGTRPEQLAQVAVTMREHAALNPLARYRDPLTIDAVLSSPMIASPFHRWDCCVVTDGGGALLICHPDLVRDARPKPVWILGGATAVGHMDGGRRDVLDLAGDRSGPEAFAAAAVRHDDIDLCMIYDSFTISVITALEGLGFCNKGEGGPYVEGGRIGRAGALPVNPDGGALSNHHPGRRGIFLAIEAARQLRGESGPRRFPMRKPHFVTGSAAFSPAATRRQP